MTELIGKAEERPTIKNQMSLQLGVNVAKDAAWVAESPAFASF